MKFYTYNYLLSRIEVTNWVQIVLIVLATSVLLFGVFKYYKEKKQSKYRELALIALFLVFILLESGLTRHRNIRLWMTDMEQRLD